MRELEGVSDGCTCAPGTIKLDCRQHGAPLVIEGPTIELPPRVRHVVTGMDPQKAMGVLGRFLGTECPRCGMSRASSYGRDSEFCSQCAFNFPENSVHGLSDVILRINALSADELTTVLSAISVIERVTDVAKQLGTMLMREKYGLEHGETKWAEPER